MMLFKHLLKRWPLMIGYIVLIIVTPIVSMNSTYSSAEMMDLATEGDYNGFVNVLLIVFMYFIAHGLLRFFTDVARAALVRQGRQSLKQDMFKQIMSAGNAFFSKPDVGFHIAAFSNDISILEYKYFEAWLEAVESLLTIATAIVAIVNLNSSMAAVILIGETFSLVLCMLIRGYSMKKNSIYIEHLALFTQRIKDYFSSFQTIRNYSVESQIKRKFSQMNKNTENSKDDADMALAFVDTLAKICNSLIKFLIVCYGVVLMMTGDMTIGLIYAAYRFTDSLVGPMHILISKINAIESVKSIVRRIKSISDACAREQKHTDPVLTQSSNIELENVSVTVDGKEILKNISHSFHKGKKYLIIGRNGAGKSTLLRLLKRSQDDYTGTIRVAGENINSLSYSALSSVVSYINESVSLICDTVKQNIVLYRNVEDERLNEVVASVGLKVPLDRVIRDGERNLSSGETRRIEIARSLINRADVIIYDEAISTLDVQTAFAIEKTLLSLEDQTVLFVSHNFSGALISHYDEIILMDKGEIFAYGTHEELMKNNEYYRNLMRIKNG